MWWCVWVVGRPLALRIKTSALNTTASLTKNPASWSKSVVSVTNSRQPQSLAVRLYRFCDSLATDLSACSGR